jgi:hypothetical protein
VLTLLVVTSSTPLLLFPRLGAYRSESLHSPPSHAVDKRGHVFFFRSYVTTLETTTGGQAIIALIPISTEPQSNYIPKEDYQASPALASPSSLRLPLLTRCQPEPHRDERKGLRGSERSNVSCLESCLRGILSLSERTLDPCSGTPSMTLSNKVRGDLRK